MVLVVSVAVATAGGGDRGPVAKGARGVLSADEPLLELLVDLGDAILVRDLGVVQHRVGPHAWRKRPGRLRLCWRLRLRLRLGRSRFRLSCSRSGLRLIRRWCGGLVFCLAILRARLLEEVAEDRLERCPHGHAGPGARSATTAQS